MGFFMKLIQNWNHREQWCSLTHPTMDRSIWRVFAIYTHWRCRGCDIQCQRTEGIVAHAVWDLLELKLFQLFHSLSAFCIKIQLIFCFLLPCAFWCPHKSKSRMFFHPNCFFMMFQEQPEAFLILIWSRKGSDKHFQQNVWPIICAYLNAMWKGVSVKLTIPLAILVSRCTLNQPCLALSLFSFSMPLLDLFCIENKVPIFCATPTCRVRDVYLNSHSTTIWVSRCTCNQICFVLSLWSLLFLLTLIVLIKKKC